jgi:possible acetyltransferase
MAGERVEELDRYKGFLIFLVVLGHFLLPVKDSGMALFSRSFYGIYSFHMPAFIFLSGYFFQQSFVKRGRKASSLFSNLLYYFLCYFFLKTLLYPFDVFCYGGQGSFPDYLHESSTPWYLLGLFFWQLACLPLCFFKRNRVYIGKGGNPEDREEKYYLLLLIFLSVFAGYLDQNRRFVDFLALDRVFGFAPFFYFGMLLSQSSFSWKKRRDGLAFFGGVSLLLFLLFFPGLKNYTRIFYGVWYRRVSKEEILPFFQSFPILLRIFYIPFALGISYFFYWILSFLGKYPLHKKILGRKSSIVGAWGRKLGITGALEDKLEFTGVWGDKYGLTEVLENLKSDLSLWGKYSLVIYLFHRPFRDLFLKMGGYSYFLQGERAVFVQLLFFLFLLSLSFTLCLLLGRESLYRLCRKRW